jgi:hypothetical protein
VNDDTEKSYEKLQELNNVTGAYYMFWLISLVQQTAAYWCAVIHTARCSELAVPPSEVLTVW